MNVQWQDAAINNYRIVCFTPLFIHIMFRTATVITYVLWGWLARSH